MISPNDGKADPFVKTKDYYLNIYIVKANKLMSTNGICFTKLSIILISYLYSNSSIQMT